MCVSSYQVRYSWCTRVHVRTQVGVKYRVKVKRYSMFQFHTSGHIPPSRPNNPLMKPHLDSLDPDYFLNLSQISDSYKYLSPKLAWFLLSRSTYYYYYYYYNCWKTPPILPCLRKWKRNPLSDLVPLQNWVSSSKVKVKSTKIITLNESICTSNKTFVSSGGALIRGSCVFVERCQAMLTRLQEVCPQLETDGLNNIWIIKPGAKSRGRGEAPWLTNITTSLQFYTHTKYW